MLMIISIVLQTLMIPKPMKLKHGLPKLEDPIQDVWHPPSSRMDTAIKELN